MTQCVTLSLFRFPRLVDRLWVFGQMGMARLPLARMNGLEFWKLCGSGSGEGFTPIPNTQVWAILGAWSDETRARAGTTEGPFARFAARASDSWTVYLTPTSSRGAWSGRDPFSAEPAPLDGPLAALTRATIKPAILRRFWGRTPDISARIGTDPNVLFKIGVGEVPWLHQITFSIWPDAASMAAFARTGPHAEAIRAVREEGWFKEELYARFAVIGTTGNWQDAPALSQEVAA